MSTPADDDWSLVAAALAGDDEAFAGLVRRHADRVLSHLARLAGRSDADDLAQETFIRAHRSLHRYDPAWSFAGWLLVIGGRLAANHRRWRRVRRLVGLDAEPAAAEPLAEDGRLAALESALAELPAASRELVELRYRQDLPIEEIARLLATTPGAVKVRLHRIRTTLHGRIAARDPASTGPDGGPHERSR